MDYKRFVLAFFIVFWFSAYVCHGDDAYITWQDLEFDGGLEHDNEGKVIVVANDGTGDSTTVQGAVDLVPNWSEERVKILIKPGVYRERVRIEITKPYISFIGTNKSNTIITYNLKAKDRDSDGHDIGTYNSTSVSVESDYFCARSITFENTVSWEAGEEGMQGVALRLSGDKALLYDCNILGSQDTLFDHQGKHFFLSCYIQGTVDFIFGNAASLYQNCILQTTTDGYGAVAASKRILPTENTGYSFVNCTLRGTSRMIYLGRAWGKYSRIIYSYCDLDESVVPEGWYDWGDSSRRSTVSFGEYKCTGKGADPSNRVKWARSVQSYDDAKPFLDQSFINGTQWLRL